MTSRSVCSSVGISTYFRSIISRTIPPSADPFSFVLNSVH
ncbi:hypothetical protein CABS03_07663 [Colletotrichum abscissum]|uniref:Uncharacterized protein n=2 Tax=Colletotrichum acutatum species complex TaxID=2707335 RepID=A0A9Q0B257_9PEZI|nr:hypothetical protein CABS02_05217 [Colletotrichum abscissum]KAK0377317.1 hypothetical protein CLIM01_05312 [Colletotrichum limetticola]